MDSIRNRGIGVCVLVGLLLSACQPARQASRTESQAAPLRNLTVAERTQDFDELLALFKAYYGPYQYKEQRFGMSIEKLAADLKAQALGAKTDEEFAGYVQQFGAALRDGHVGIRIEHTASGISTYSLPILLTPVEGKAIVAEIDEDLKKRIGVSVGDEVTEVDGKAPLDYLPTLLKYRSAATDLSNLHYVALVLARPSYITELVPTSPTVRIKVKTAKDTQVQLDLPWQVTKYNKDLDTLVPYRAQLDLRAPIADELNSIVPGSHRKQMGQVEPVFLTPEVQQKFGFRKVYPSDAARKKFGLDEKEKPPIYAALYRYQGKVVLLMRNSTYYPQDFKPAVYMKAYMALIDEYQELADVLVLDQTHNGGGSYCADFYDLFARKGDRQGMELVRADRKWVHDLKINWAQEDPDMKPGSWDAKVSEAWSLTVEKAYDQGRFLSDPIPLFSGFAYSQPRQVNWTKPMLVLIDELAGSCADIFPMLVKANQRAKLFGQTTMGLGGNVEPVGILPNSRIGVRMTRGLFYPYRENAEPTAEEFIENNGVAPDFPYAHTLKDFRGGFVDYVKAFSDKAVEQLTQ